MREVSHGLFVVAKRGILGGAAHGKFVHVQSSEDNGARSLQLGNSGRVINGNEIAENF